MPRPLPSARAAKLLVLLAGAGRALVGGRSDPGGRREPGGPPGQAPDLEPVPRGGPAPALAPRTEADVLQAATRRAPGGGALAEAVPERSRHAHDARAVRLPRQRPRCAKRGLSYAPVATVTNADF